LGGFNLNYCNLEILKFLYSRKVTLLDTDIKKSVKSLELNFIAYYFAFNNVIKSADVYNYTQICVNVGNAECPRHRIM
jgi:hypothetical protein